MKNLINLKFQKVGNDIPLSGVVSDDTFT